MQWFLSVMTIGLGVCFVWMQWYQRSRSTKLILPDTRPNAPVPLLIALHPHRTNAHIFARMSGLSRLANGQNVIVAFPNAYNYVWNDGAQSRRSQQDDTIALLTLIDEIDQQMPIDRDRIYLAGYSNGAMMALRAVCEAPGIFAGVASVGGTLFKRFASEPATPTDVLLIHGTADQAVKFTGGQTYFSIPETAAHWAQVNKCDHYPFRQPLSFVERVATIQTRHCNSEKTVKMIVFEDVPHVWLGSVDNFRGKQPPPHIDTARLIWDFFALSTREVER